MCKIVQLLAAKNFFRKHSAGSFREAIIPEAEICPITISEFSEL